MIFDTHCHLGHDAGCDPAAERDRAAAAGVTRLLVVGIDLDSSRRARALASELDGVDWSAGLHPCDAQRWTEQADDLTQLAREPDCVAVGETGLDFYWDSCPREIQEASFTAHLELARRLDKPVIVHCRDAYPRTLEVLEAHRGVRGVMHCFSAGVDEARRCLDLGMYLSFAGPLTYPRADALRQAAAFAPEDRILVETDAPFLPPQGRRGERNEPAYIVTTLARLAEVRGISKARAERITTANAIRLFG